jgi:hypothetical protein
MTDIVMEDTEDLGVPVRTEGSDEVVIPAPCCVTVFASTADVGAPVTEHLVVGWNSAGSPIVIGADGGLELLAADVHVRDVTWEG